MTRSANVVILIWSIHPILLPRNDVSIYFTSTCRPYEPFCLLSGFLDFYGWIPIVFFNNIFLCKWGVSKIVDPQNHRFQSKHDYHKFPNPWRKNAKSSIYCLAFSWIFYDINHPPDRKPRVTALTFVHNLFGTKCTKHEVSAHFNFFWFFFVAIPWCFFFFEHFVRWKWVFFCFASPKRGCNQCLWVSFPHLPVKIGTVQPSDACCTAFAIVFNMSLHILI